MSEKTISRYCPFNFVLRRGGGGEDWEHEASDILAIEKEFREREAKELSLAPVEGGGATERGKSAVKRAARQFAKLGSARFLRPFCIGRYVNKTKKEDSYFITISPFLLQRSILCVTLGIWTSYLSYIKAFCDLAQIKK
jgi:hypothetical protein